MASFIHLLILLLTNSYARGQRSADAFSCSPMIDNTNNKVTSLICGSHGSFLPSDTCVRHPTNNRQSRFLDEAADPPESIEGIDEVTFTAYKSSEPQTGYLFSYKNHNDFITNIFGNCKKVTFIVHGFKTNTLDKFLKIKDALLTRLEPDLKPDVVVIVDWRDYSKLKKSDLFMGYKDAAQNANRIGSEIAHVVFLLVKHKHIDPSDVHLIGFSLGAQAMGVAGRKVVLSYGFKKKLGRITGLE